MATLPSVEAIEKKRQFGQVFTPPDVAEWMVREALRGSPKTVLDPALGGGVFVDALKRSAKLSKPLRIIAYEIDSGFADAARRRWTSRELLIRRRDFVEAANKDMFDACVANPPYVRHHRLNYSEDVFGRFDRQIDGRISRSCNLYILFMLRIWESLAENGRAVVITPLEWLNADYGRAIKRYLLKQNAIDSMVLFDDATSVFGDALTTAGITILRRGREGDAPIRVATVADRAELHDLDISQARAFSRDELDPTEKWTPMLRTTARRQRSANTKTIQLGDVALCSRGIATGANDFFTLSEPRRVEFEIDRRDVSRCICKAVDVEDKRFDELSWRRLRDEGRRVWLLTPRRHLNKALQRYLQHGEAQRIHERYLPAHRPVWYRPEARRSAAIWVSVFFRERPRVVRNVAEALNLTAYHGVYPRDPSAETADRLFEWLASDAALAEFDRHCRVYGGGLRKVEPRDVMAMRIPKALIIV